MSWVASLQAVDKRYLDGDRQVQVLRNFSLDVHAGESVALTGPSGSGKSTVLNILAGRLPVDTGKVLLRHDEQVTALHLSSDRERTRLRRRHIGYIYQFFNLVPTLTVLENVCLPAALNRRRDLFATARQMLCDLGLERRLQVFPEVLSGGEQQRVAVARALLLQPPLLLADEPTGNLDAENSTHVADALFDAASRFSVALIIATHSEQIAQRARRRVHMAVADGADGANEAP